MVMVALAGAAAYFTGDAADIFEGSPQEEYVERHEEAAETTWIVCIVAGLVGLAGLVVTKRLQEVPVLLMLVALAVLLGTFYLILKTSNLGGQILHPETRSDSLTKFLNPN
jgi:undecaprenyl pyrophosphate phosphatase UppP